MIKQPRILAICALFFTLGVYMAGTTIVAVIAIAAIIMLTGFMLRKGAFTAAIVAAALFAGFFYTNFVYDKNLSRAKSFADEVEGFYCRVTSVPESEDGICYADASCEGGKIKLYLYGLSPSYGDILFVEAKPEIKEGFTRVTDGAYLSAYANNASVAGSDINYYNISDVAVILREKMLAAADKIWSGESLMFARSVLFGSRAYSSAEFSEKLASGSISHLVAISGLHVSFMAFFVLYIIKALTLKRGFRLLCLPFAAFFVVMTGASPSAVRALIMFAVLILAKVIHADYDAYTSLGVSALIILLINPMAAYSLSFMLSYAAVLGITVFSGEVKEKLSFLPSAVAEAVSTTVSAQFFTFPILALYFESVPLTALAANLFAVPLLPFVMASGYIAVILKLLGKGALFGKIADILIGFILKTAENASHLPFASIDVDVGSGALFMAFSLFLLAAVLLYFKAKRCKAAYVSFNAALIFLAASLLYQPFVSDGIYCFGGSALICEGGDTVLFVSDAERGAADKELEKLKIKKVDVIAVTDEFDGADFKKLCDNLSPRMVVLPYSFDADVRVTVAKDGDCFSVKNISAEVIREDERLSYMVSAFGKRIFMFSGKESRMCDIACYLSGYPERLPDEMKSAAYCITGEDSKVYLSAEEMEAL